tara:strand:- start:864 stop:1118 length:255 start_codon:yes stop_codon:yes gene_type:complete
MSTTQITFADADWQLVSSSTTGVIIQAVGTSIQVYLGSGVPTGADVGFSIEQGTPLEINSVDVYGPNLYVRSVNGYGAVRYAAA